MAEVNIVACPPILKGYATRSDGLIWYNYDTYMLYNSVKLIPLFLQLYPASTWVIRIAKLRFNVSAKLSLVDSKISDSYGTIILPEKAISLFAINLSFDGLVQADLCLPKKWDWEALNSNVIPAYSGLRSFNSSKTAGISPSAVTSDVFVITDR